MQRADVFTVKENITMTFESKGKQYLMRLNIEEGLIMLDEVKGKKFSNSRAFFIEDTNKTIEAEFIEEEPISIEDKAEPKED